MTTKMEELSEDITDFLNSDTSSLIPPGEDVTDWHVSVIMGMVTSHMQTAFDDVIADDEFRPEYISNPSAHEIASNDRLRARDSLRREQRDRAAEWLLGSKENG